MRRRSQQSHRPAHCIRNLRYHGWRTWLCRVEVSFDGDSQISLLKHNIRWLFFIEGALTSVVVAIPLDLIPDFPTTPASWLTTEEQFLAQERMMEDVCGVEDNPVKNARRSGLTEASTDWTVWWLALTTTFMNIMLSFQSFFPTLVATIGYGPIVSLLLCSPPWIIGVATSIWVMRFVLHEVFHFIDHLSTS